jgi:hypothetical protein
MEKRNYIVKPEDDDFRELIRLDICRNTEIKEKDWITEYQYCGGMIISDWDININEESINKNTICSHSMSTIHKLCEESDIDKEYIMPIGKCASITEDKEFSDEELVFERIERSILDLFNGGKHIENISVKFEREKQKEEVTEKVGEITYYIEGHTSKEYFEYLDMETL